MTRLDYYKVEPHKIALLGKNYTTASRRKGQIKYITRHHTAGILDAAALNRVWKDRPASTHYLADQHGIISQHVWDRHIAWSNGNAASNRETLTIEHSNNGGASQGWPISQATIIAGARWAAALCLYYGLGRPVFGKNIRDHREFTSTSCPHHLANGGKYHQQWMDEAQRFYDQLARKSVNKDGTPKAGATKTTPAQHPKPKEQNVLTPKYFTDFITGYLGPQIDALQEVWRQLRGPGGKGWAQLGQNSKGQNLTLVDGVAALRNDVAELRAIIEEKGTK